MHKILITLKHYFGELGEIIEMIFPFESECHFKVMTFNLDFRLKTDGSIIETLSYSNFCLTKNPFYSCQLLLFNK